MLNPPGVSKNPSLVLPSTSDRTEEQQMAQMYTSPSIVSASLSPLGMVGKQVVLAKPGPTHPRDLAQQRDADYGNRQDRQGRPDQKRRQEQQKMGETARSHVTASSNQDLANLGVAATGDGEESPRRRVGLQSPKRA